MIIWIMALVLVAATVVLGYTMGAVRVGITTIGLALGAWIAVPVSTILYPMFDKLGLGTKFHTIFIAPLVVLMVVLVAFKAVASTVHRKVDTYYKYKTPELTQTLWERSNERFGIALALVNATMYLFILCTFIYVLAYPVRLLSSGDSDSASWRYLMKSYDALVSTKMDRAVAAFNPAPKEYYNNCDMLGLVYQNPLLLGRLTSYPPIMALGEQEEFRPMFRDIAGDSPLATKLMQTPRPPFQELLGEPKIRGIFTNKLFMAEIFKLDFKDLSNYLATGTSAKFSDEQILGRWNYDFDASLRAQRRTKPRWTPVEFLRLRLGYTTNLESATITALLNNQFILKAMDPNKNESMIKGSWSNAGGGSYDLNWESGGLWAGSLKIQGSTLQIKYRAGNERDGRVMVFDKE